MVALLLLFSSIFLLCYFLKISSATSTKRPPPSPLKLPIIGHFYLAGTLAHRSFHSLANRYGELLLLHFGTTPVVVASSASAAREIMQKQDLIFANRPNLSIPDRLIYSCRDVAFAAYGHHWRQARSICTLRLLSNKRVQSFRCIREEETSLMIEKIKRSSPLVVNLSELFVTMTNDIICRAVLGRTHGGGGDGERDFNRILGRALELLGTFDVGDFVPWLAWINRINGLDGEVEKVCKLLDEFLEGVLREYREKKVSGDAVVNLVDALLEFQRESEDSAPFEDDLIKALILVGISSLSHLVFHFTRSSKVSMLNLCELLCKSLIFQKN